MGVEYLAGYSKTYTLKLASVTNSRKLTLPNRTFFLVRPADARRDGAVFSRGWWIPEVSEGKYIIYTGIPCEPGALVVLIIVVLEID